jgi:Calcineurin-like phosphoesterase
MPIQICHISDPHFGSAHAADVWSTVAVHLRNVRPMFLLVTGDVADSPKRDFFDTGHKEFDALQIPYMVVPGNHDRFTKAIGSVSGLAGWLVRRSISIRYLAAASLRRARWPSSHSPTEVTGEEFALSESILVAVLIISPVATSIQRIWSLPRERSEAQRARI